MQVLTKIPKAGQLIYSPKGFTGKVLTVRFFNEIYKHEDPNYLRGVENVLREELGANFKQLFFEVDVLVMETEPHYTLYKGQIEVLTYGEYQNCNDI